MTQPIDRHGLQNAVLTAQSSYSVVVVDIELTARQQQTHSGVRLSLLQNFKEAIEELWMTARGETGGIELIDDQHAVSTLCDCGENISGGAWEPELPADIAGQ